ncbi:DMT family transporter [Paenibacillus aceris]|uniref:Drug/metabolite transporter (DMT)-like permease n=1 Tax=Paenibacillus aceris TaxID=869555 RepID=A0ABS4I4L7_9BACL|nr:EamA family transporter [Paenibacillus aceris]MBP1965866.1 drug/metabolite transporter (DMT)-like permease [Paenibacillus aceris]NHW35131.1 EamA family transporter [Paenibacillus aceris]
MIIFNYLLICLIFGTTFLAIKVGVDASAPPFFSAGLRFFIAGLLLFCWLIWRKKASLGLLFRKEMLLTGIGLTFGTFSTLYWAEQYVSSGIAAVLSATGPIMILVLQTFVLRLKTTALSVFGCILGFAGIVILLLPQLAVSANIVWVIGSTAILVGELFYCCGALYSKRVIQQFPEASPIALNAAQMICGGLLLLLLSLFTEHVDVRLIFSPKAAGSLLYLIVIGSMVGHSLFYWLVAKTNPVFPATWLYISPLIALAVGVVFYGETITWVTAAGVLTVIAGTICANLDSLKPLMQRRKTA